MESSPDSNGYTVTSCNYIKRIVSVEIVDDMLLFLI